jgi:hypothetical protein
MQDCSIMQHSTAQHVPHEAGCRCKQTTIPGFSPLFCCRCAPSVKGLPSRPPNGSGCCCCCGGGPLTASLIRWLFDPRGFCTKQESKQVQTCSTGKHAQGSKETNKKGVSKGTIRHGQDCREDRRHSALTLSQID